MTGKIYAKKSVDLMHEDLQQLQYIKLTLSQAHSIHMKYGPLDSFL